MAGHRPRAGAPPPRPRLPGVPGGQGGARPAHRPRPPAHRGQPPPPAGHRRFRYHPVAGLAPLRDFYGSFADSVFHSTQYLRHPSQPLYTPEPDVVHEVVGHANQLACPEFAAIYRLVGEAVARTESDDGLRLLSRIFWFTMEFGLVEEGGRPKAYGAGILSSCGETATFLGADIRPLDVAEMAAVPYDITRFQPVLFAARSMTHLVDTLSAFFAAFDDDTHHRPRPSHSGARMTLTDTAPPPPPCPTAGSHARAVLLGWDAIELWVGNARAVAGFLSSAFGFRVTAYAGPETGWSDRASYVLEQGRIRLVVTAALTPDSPIAAHVREHGDGVHNLALAVDDVDVTYRSAVARGARGIDEPHTDADRHGLLRSASIAIYGETRHTFVDRSSYRGPYLPGYTDRRPPPGAGRPAGGPQPRRPRGRQRGARLAGAVGRLLPVRPRLRPAAPLRRRPDLHRVLGPHVHRGVGRQPHRPAPERAGQGAPQEPDPGVHRDLPGTGRAAHRPPHRRHRPGGGGPPQPGRALPGGPGHATTTTSAAAWATSTCRGTTSSASASWSTRSPTAGCCRSSPRPSPTGPPSSSRSSSGAGPRASAPATSRPCSRPSSGSRPAGVTCDQDHRRRPALSVGSLSHGHQATRRASGGRFG